MGQWPPNAHGLKYLDYGFQEEKLTSILASSQFFHQQYSSKYFSISTSFENLKVLPNKKPKSSMMKTKKTVPTSYIHHLLIKVFQKCCLSYASNWLGYKRYCTLKIVEKFSKISMFQNKDNCW